MEHRVTVNQSPRHRMGFIDVALDGEIVRSFDCRDAFAFEIANVYADGVRVGIRRTASPTTEGE